jgi:hypothetical protein
MDGRMTVLSHEPIRLLVVGLSTLAHDLVTAVAADGIELVESPTSVDLVDALHTQRIDFVLLPLEQSDLPNGVQQYLADQAHVRVIGVREADGRAFLYQLVPERRELGDVAPVELVDAIRRAAAEEA